MIEVEHAYKDLALYISNPKEFNKQFPQIKRQELLTKCATYHVTIQGFAQRFPKIYELASAGQYDHLHW